MGQNDSNTSVATYRIRWYLLCILSTHACVFNAAWAEWGPIAQSAKAVYGWTDTTVYMLTTIGNVGTILSMLPIAWLVDTQGLRLTLMISSIVTTAGLGLRCITTERQTATWLIFLGQLFNGLGGAVDTVAATSLSETWFPPEQRVTASGVSLLFSVLGGAVAFILGPNVVPEPDKYCIYNISLKECNATITRNLPIITNRIKLLNFIEFGWAGLIMLAVCVHFPNKPQIPPSTTAAAERISFLVGLKRIIKNVSFWKLASTFSVSSGVFGVWISSLDVNLKHFEISQTEAGYLSFFGSIGGIILGLLVARFSDIFRKRMRFNIVLGYSGSTLLFLIFALQCTKVVPKSTALFYFTCIGGISLLTGLIPLFYELSCETVYPVAEGVTCGVLCLFQNLTGAIFLCLMLIPDIGNSWINFGVAGCVGICVPFLLTLKENYNRLTIDISHHCQTNSSDSNVPYNTQVDNTT